MASPTRPHQAIESEFPTDTEGLADAHGSERLELADGDQVTLEIAPVRRSRSAAPTCECSPTTARFPAQRS